MKKILLFCIAMFLFSCTYKDKPIYEENYKDCVFKIFKLNHSIFSGKEYTYVIFVDKNNKTLKYKYVEPGNLEKDLNECRLYVDNTSTYFLNGGEIDDLRFIDKLKGDIK